MCAEFRDLKRLAESRVAFELFGDVRRFKPFAASVRLNADDIERNIFRRHLFQQFEIFIAVVIMLYVRAENAVFID